MQTGALHLTLTNRASANASGTVYRVVFVTWTRARAVRIGECQGHAELLSLLGLLDIDVADREHSLRRLGLNGHASLQALHLSERQLAWFD